MTLRTLILVCLFAQLMSSEAFSCSCISSGGCPGLGGTARPVFVGTVLNITDLPQTKDIAYLSSRKVRIQVNESFGGIPSDAKEVDVLTGSGSGDCGIPFKSGDVYLIDATIGADGLIHAGICSASRKLEYAGAALRVLRKMRDGYKVPSLTGRIAQRDRDFQGLLGTREAKPLANRMVRVKGEGGMFEARSDAEGIYEFYDIPSGKYEFAPDLPEGTTLSWYIGSNRPLGAFDFEGGCKEEDIDVFASGSIQGRVLDSLNNVLPHAFVYIVPVDIEEIPKASQLYWANQDKEGAFKFVHIPPGDYVILVNPNDAQDPEFPYSRTFYPAVHDRNSAKIISLSAGEQIRNADIHVQEQFTPRHLNVRITWADGQIIRDFVFVEAKGTANPAAMAQTSQPDLKQSLVNLSVLPNESYDVEAQLICRYFDGRISGPGATLHSNKAHVKPSDGQAELVLTIPTNSCPELAGKRLENNNR